MNENYVKLAVLRAAIREAWEQPGDEDTRRDAIVKFCKTLEGAFKKAHNFRLALVMAALARDVRYAPSLMAVFRSVEREALHEVLQGAVPHSNTGPTSVEGSNDNVV
jgi:hypothetical protein